MTPAELSQEEKIKAILEACGWTDLYLLDLTDTPHRYGGYFNHIKKECPDLAHSIDPWFAQGGPVEWLENNGWYYNISPSAIFVNRDLLNSESFVAPLDNTIPDPIARICAALTDAVYEAMMKVEEG